MPSDPEPSPAAKPAGPAFEDTAAKPARPAFEDTGVRGPLSCLFWLSEFSMTTETARSAPIRFGSSVQ
ncbi:hypothetical protein ACWCOZ_30580, partial [Streptomyces sp. NPDC001840]